MNLLLDTHIAIWAIAGSPRLGAAARGLIEAPNAVIWVSVASIWEIAIKHSFGRSNMPLSGQAAIGYFQQSGYRLLAIEPEHAAAVELLEPHHQDPVDRLIVAQALIEPMRLITHDATVARYSDTIVLA